MIYNHIHTYICHTYVHASFKYYSFWSQCVEDARKNFKSSGDGVYLLVFLWLNLPVSSYITKMRSIKNSLQELAGLFSTIWNPRLSKECPFLKRCGWWRGQKSQKQYILKWGNTAMPNKCINRFSFIFIIIFAKK